VRADVLEVHVGVREAADCELLDQLVRSDGTNGVVVVAGEDQDLRVPAQRREVHQRVHQPGGEDAEDPARHETRD